MNDDVMQIREALTALQFALDKYPERVEVAPVRDLVIETARQNPRRSAYLKLAVPDEVVKAVKGPESKTQDMLLLVSIPKEVQERSQSSIILPGEA